VHLLPAWFSGRMVGLRGRFDLMLTTGDVMRCTSIVAVHLSSTGIVLLDVLLDNAGVPDGVDLAWRSKHFLGLPVPAATLATINLAHVVAAIEFVAAEFAEKDDENTVLSADEISMEVGDDPEARVLQAVREPLRPRLSRSACGSTLPDHAKGSRLRVETSKGQSIHVTNSC
jgi:hypothetical protein